MINRLDKLSKGHMDRSNIGKKYWDSALDLIDDKYSYKKYITRYIEDIQVNLSKGRGLFLWGSHGHGKTSSAVICMKYALLHMKTSYLVRCDKLQNLFISKQAFDAEVSIIERCQSCDLLVMDDLGIEHIKDFGNTVIEGLMRERSSKNKSTIITSNLAPKSIKAKYGEGVKSILMESFFTVPVEGHDWRVRSSKDMKDYFTGV